MDSLYVRREDVEDAVRNYMYIHIRSNTDAIPRTEGFSCRAEQRAVY